MTNEVHSALHGTKTEENLHNAFSDEATTYMKYRLFANAARQNGNDSLARTLEANAGNELEHAELILEYLDGISDDKNNTSVMIAGEDYASLVEYPEMADIADSEGFAEIAEKLRCVAKAEKRHSKLLNDHLLRMSTDDNAENTEMLCSVCGYVHSEGALPQRCPLCSRPSVNFVPAER